jgi:hypothetical protein
VVNPWLRTLADDLDEPWMTEERRTTLATYLQDRLEDWFADHRPECRCRLGEDNVCPRHSKPEPEGAFMP